MKIFSKNQLQRYPIYLKFFKEVEASGQKYISSPAIASVLGYSEEQIRKDLQAVSNDAGRPKKGREVKKLIETLENFLGYSEPIKAAVVGVGHLGVALMNYPNFSDMGLAIVAGFDIDQNKIGKEVAGKHIYSTEEMEEILPKLDINIIILTTPSKCAQEVADKAIRAGALAIWNFVPAHLQIPSNIVIENVNLASSLAILSHNLNSLMRLRKSI